MYLIGLARFLARTKEPFKERRAKSNLLPHQEALLKSLREDPTLLSPEIDKGLGPCAITYDQYVEDCLIHLRSKTGYQRLSEVEAMEAVAILDKEIKAWLKNTKMLLARRTRSVTSKNT